MTTVQEASAKYTEKSFLAFLNNEAGCGEKYVRGVASASMPEDIDRALQVLSYHSNKQGLEFLKSFSR